MKILLVNNYYQIEGGEHTVFHNEQKLLRNNGHEVITYVRSNAEIKKSIIKKILLPFTAFFSIKTFFEIKKIIKKEKIEIVHCHNTFPLISPSVYYASWVSKVPVVQSIHNFRLICPCGLLYRDGQTCEECCSYGLKRALRYSCYRNSKIETLVVCNMLFLHRLLGTYKRLRYIFLTDFNKEKFRFLLGEKVDSEFVKENFDFLKIKRTNQKRKDFIYIGRLDGNKGIDFLLKAWRTNSDYRLLVFGDGEYAERVRNAQKLNPNIVYFGYQDKKIVLNYLSQSIALIFPSELYEGFPMTIVESFACGTPVICSNFGNHAEIVRKAQAGVFFQIGSIYSFRNAVEEMIVKEESLKVNAIKVFEKEFTAQRNYKKIIDIYESLLK